MAKQQDVSSTSLPFAADQTVQTTVQAGTWMFLQQAMEATGVSEKTLRRYIKSGKVKSRKLGKQPNSPFQVWITPSLRALEPDEPPMVAEAADIMDAESEELNLDGLHSDADSGAENQTDDIQFESNSDVSLQLDQVIRTIAEQFSQQLDQHKEMIFELRNELQEKDTQLRLLPDLQKQLEEKSKLSEFESIALRKQIDELKAENSQLRETNETATMKAEESKRKAWWKKWFLPVGSES